MRYNFYMRKIFTFLVVITSIFASSKVAATIKPLSLLVQEIYGEKVITILPPNRSPHFFSPSPSMIKEVTKSRVLFKIGAGLEFWKIEGVKTVDLSTSVELIKENGRVNPHYWLSPLRVKPVVEEIGKVLISIFPERANEISKRASQVKEELEELDFLIRKQARPLKKKRVILYHPAWEYFFRDYGFQIAGIITKNPGEPPKPANLKNLQADLLVLDPPVPETFARSICEGKNMKYIYLDPLASDPEVKTYREFILNNFEKIKEGLQ